MGRDRSLLRSSTHNQIVLINIMVVRNWSSRLTSVTRVKPADQRSVPKTIISLTRAQSPGRVNLWLRRGSKIIIWFLRYWTGQLVVNPKLTWPVRTGMILSVARLLVEPRPRKEPSWLNRNSATVRGSCRVRVPAFKMELYPPAHH